MLVALCCLRNCSKMSTLDSDDWKLEAQAVVKLYRKNSMFVSLQIFSYRNRIPKVIKFLGHMNIRGPQLFYSFFIRWLKVVRIGALFADWSCALVLRSFRFQ